MCWPESEDVRRLYDEDETIRRIFDYALKLEGHIKTVGVHASGVIISDKPLENYTSLIVTKSGVATQYEFNDVEKIGLLKMDFLGLDNVNVIAETVRLLRRRGGSSWISSEIPLDDAQDLRIFSPRGSRLARSNLKVRSTRDCSAGSSRRRSTT